MADSGGALCARMRPPALNVGAAEETIDLRAWARAYVQLLCTIEGVAAIPSPLERAS